MSQQKDLGIDEVREKAELYGSIATRGLLTVAACSPGNIDSKEFLADLVRAHNNFFSVDPKKDREFDTFLHEVFTKRRDAAAERATDELMLIITPRLGPARSAKLIDLAFTVIQGFPAEREFTTADLREELAKRYPDRFANFNPASISGTVARLFNDYDAVVRVGTYTDGIHYRRKVEAEAKKEEETPMIATTTPP